MQITFNIKTLDSKPKAKSTLIIDLLKKRGISGSLAKQMYCQYSSEYLIRKNWLLDYYHEKGLKISDNRRWLLACINNDYSEPEAFHDWFKFKRKQIMQGNNDELKELI